MTEVGAIAFWRIVASIERSDGDLGTRRYHFKRGTGCR
jgi:hypothetical protein